MNVFDSFANAIRAPLLRIIPLVGILAVVGYGAMGVLAVSSWPWWASLAVIASQLLGLVGFASLLDSLRDQLRRREDGQS